MGTTTITPTLATSIDTLTHSTATFTISNALLIWTGIFMASLITIILLLTWLLVRREKALQLMAFSISPVGLKLTYELNKDEKLKLLTLDNLALQSEVNALKSTLSSERWRSIGVFFMFLMFFLLMYVFNKLKFTKDK